jgi:uncharacterized membrane protein YebE (DUF533 family)
MAMAEILGALLQQGMAGQSQARLRSGAQSASAGGGMEALRDALMGGGAPAGGTRAAAPGSGLEDLLGSMLGGGGATAPGRAPGGAARGGAGGLEDLLGSILGGAAGGRAGGGAPAPGGGGLGDLLGAVLGGASPQGRAPSGGGLGDLLGAVLGGGAGSRSAVGGGAMAILASVAMSALKSYMAQGGASAAAAVSPDQARALLGADAERLMLSAMLSAAKADGRLDREEVSKITAKAGEGGVTPEEKAFLDAELAKPVDLAGLAAQARSPAMAAQVYTASVLAIEIDTPAEQAYLRDLAAALGLDPRAVAEVHRMTGAPAV